MALDYNDMRRRAADWASLSDRELRVLEQRARRVAERQGLQLQRSRRRDPNAIDFGRYRLIDPRLNAVVHGAGNFDYELDLQGVVEFLLDRNAAVG